MYDSWKKWFVKWMAVVLTVVMGMGPCAGLPVGAAYENTHTNTGNQRADIVAIAQTQVGYREGSLDGTISGSNNYTKYNVDLYKIDGSYCYAWCQSFIAWCAKQAGVSSSVIKRTAGTIDAMDFFKSQQVWQGNSYTPQSGDIIYFRSSSSNSGYHVGIVESVSGSTIHTIEGNYSNKVARHSVSVGASSIVGYGVPNYEGMDPPSNLSISTDKKFYTVGETINFTFTSANATELYIPIDVNGVRKHFIDVTGKTTYSCSFDEAGTYGFFLFARNPFGESSTVKNYIQFEVRDSNFGDLNTDGTLTSSDTILLQDYLLGRSALTNDQKQQADLNQDGVIDGFDLALLKHLLLASE